MHARKPIHILVTYIKQPEINGFRALAEKVIAGLNRQDIGFTECHIADVLQASEQLVKDGCKILLCTGATAQYLQKKLNIDIFIIRAEGFDILEAISSIQQLKKIALLSSHSPSNLNHYSQIFALDLKQFSYDSYLSAKKAIQQIQQLGFKAVIGSPVAVELAFTAGLDAKLSIGEHSLRTIIQQALYRFERLQQQQTQFQHLSQVFHHLQEGVCLVSAQGQIEFCNTAMQTICDLPLDRLQYYSIEKLFIGFDFKQAKLSTQNPYILQYQKKRLALHSHPLNQHLETQSFQQQGLEQRRLEQRRLEQRGLEQQGYLITIQEVAELEKTSRAVRKSSPHYQTRYQFSHIITQDDHFKQTLILAQAYAKTDKTILITGETGTGKEMLAQSIHAESSRQNFPFVVMNCAAFPDNLLESELFGYEEGAFTGAKKTGKAGLIELAHQGTLFLDEIGDMPLHLQTRLLRVLQEKQVQRLGAVTSQTVDLRVITATHHNLEHAIEQGTFRADLYYRLNLLRLSLPPLRERPNDIVPLSNHILQQAQLSFQQLPKNLQSALQQAPWHGNIRELENILERLIILLTLAAPEQEVFIQAQLPELFLHQQKTEHAINLKQLNQLQEHALIVHTLKANAGNMEQTAAQLNISRTTLWRKLKQNSAE